VAWPQFGPVERGRLANCRPICISVGNNAIPTDLSRVEIARIVIAFADGALRAHEAGFDVVELHAAHGYLLNQFIFPLSTRRPRGGRRSGCGVVERKAPASRNLRANWVYGGWSVADSVVLGRQLREHGVDLVDTSSGGVGAAQQISDGPGYQVPFARDVRKRAASRLVQPA